MGVRGRAITIVGALLLVALSTPGAGAQDRDLQDEEARGLFNAGMSAFEDARFEDALGYFRRAYELSGRVELLYNVGTAADRLRRDEEALEAFEAFLQGVPPDHRRRRDVEVRVVAIRESLADHDGAGEDEDVVAPAEGEAPSGPSTLAIGGSATLIAAGLAGIGAAVGGAVRGGACVDRRVPGDADSPCIETRETRRGPVVTFASLGVAALAGGVVWLILALGDDETEERVRATPDGIEVRF